MYRVILVANGEYKKTLHKCKKKDTAFINFHIIKEKNKVFYPKRYINNNKIIPVEYQICLIKPTESTDSFRILRDKFGKLYTEKPLGEWTILHSAPYEIEETFWIYGLSSNLNRPTIHEVIKRLMVNAFSKTKVKQVIIVHNKLLIYNEEQFDMIICKNLAEAQRLHHTLAKITKKQKIKSCLFMGTASKAMIGTLYDLIKSKTNWKIEKIRRTSTRP